MTRVLPSLLINNFFHGQVQVLAVSPAALGATLDLKASEAPQMKALGQAAVEQVGQILPVEVGQSLVEVAAQEASSLGQSGPPAHHPLLALSLASLAPLPPSSLAPPAHHPHPLPLSSLV